MGSWEGRPLRLPQPPDIEHVPDHAASIIAAARQFNQVDLDHSVASLDLVDGIVESFRKEGAGSDDVAETLWQFGCYVGEVFVRNAGARWITTPDRYRDLFGLPIILECADGRL